MEIHALSRQCAAHYHIRPDLLEAGAVARLVRESSLRAGVRGLYRKQDLHVLVHQQLHLKLCRYLLLPEFLHANDQLNHRHDLQTSLLERLRVLLREDFCRSQDP